MKKLTQCISFLSLLLTLLPSFLVYLQLISPQLNKTLMLIGTIGWFVTASYWMNKPNNQHADTIYK
jgi:hypothetical protein